MRQKLIQFMQGRAGNDNLNSFLMVCAVLFLILGIAFRGTASTVLDLMALACYSLMAFRMLSRNIYKRGEENAKYVRTRYAVLAWVRVRHERWVQRKDYKFFTCPACRTTLRVPRGKGKISIVCRKCGNSFVGKT